MLERLRRLLSSTIHDLVEAARDSELELARLVDQLEVSLGEVRSEKAETQSRHRHLLSELAEHDSAAEDLMKKAEKAVTSGQDDLAKEALQRRRQRMAQADNCKERLAEAEKALATLGRDEVLLETKLREARFEEKRLAARLRRAESEKHAADAITRVETRGKATEGVEDEIVTLEAEGEAIRQVGELSVENEFRNLESSRSVEDELEAIKKRLKKDV